MSKSLKIILWSLFGILVVAAMGIKFYLDVPLPQYSGKVRVAGLQDTVDVFTDQYGAPHVFAKNEQDLFYSAGYIVAGERLFQMSVVASASRGELSRFLGDDLVKSDIYMRTWGIPHISRKIAAGMEPEIKKYLEDYCRGINDRINAVSNDLPLEFKLLRTEPVKWTPADVVGYVRLMAHDLQQSWKVELVFGALVEKFGTEKIKALFPVNIDDITFAPPDASLGALFSAMATHETILRELTGMNGTVMGSNNWVISGSRTASGKPILANDPHLGFAQPAKWYEMHLKGGSFDVSGVCLAGVPLPVIGQNENCAWGFTNVMADDIDFFVETVHPEDPLLYLYDGKWKKMDTRIEVIPLKTGGDTTVVVRLTHHGPIISDIHPLLKHGEKVVSMAWVGHQESKEITGLINLARIRDWDDFNEALKDFWIPGQNIIYADRKGNIGWRPAVKVPLRKDGASLLPRPGEDPAYDWQGFVPYDEMPILFNPEEGFIATANNKIVDDSFPYYISNQWGNPARINRIREMIGSKAKITVEDVKKMHLDVLNTQARELTPYLVNTRKGNETGSLEAAFDILEQWDWVEDPQSAGALLYHTIYNHLLRNVYGDELALAGEGLLEAFVEQPMVPTRSLKALIRNGESEWFDDLSTPETETLKDILYRSVIDGVAEVENRLGEDPNQWAWGKVHTLTHKHSLGKIKALDFLFGLNVGPFVTGGSDATLNKGEYRMLRDYRQIIGPSMRRIVDFDDLNQTQFILPTGQSGIPTSPHYKDQAKMFNSGEYRTTWFDEDYIRTSRDFRHLVLIPD